MDFENPFSRHRPPTSKYRAESKSPERYTGSSVLRGRDTFRGPAPLNRTQSAAHVTSKTRSISVDTHEPTMRSASVTPGQVPGNRPGSAMGGSTSSLNRAPSYRLLGGKLVDSMFQRDTSWKDDDGCSAATDQAASLNILREPYLITTKDGRKQTLAEYEKSLVQDYKRRSQLNLAN